MDTKSMRKYSSLVKRKMQFKTTMKCPFPAVGMTVIKKTQMLMKMWKRDNPDTLLLEM